MLGANSHHAQGVLVDRRGLTALITRPTMMSMGRLPRVAFEFQWEEAFATVRVTVGRRRPRNRVSVDGVDS